MTDGHIAAITVGHIQAGAVRDHLDALKTNKPKSGGDPLGLAFTAGGVATGLVPGKSAAASAYSYVFSVNRQLGGHLGNG